MLGILIRRKKEEGRGKKEEGRRKREEGRRKREEGRRKREEGRRKKALRPFAHRTDTLPKLFDPSLTEQIHFLNSSTLRLRSGYGCKN
jgi:hypothetical protein